MTTYSPIKVKILSYFCGVKYVKLSLVVFSFGILFVGNIGMNVFKHICKEDGVSISYFLQDEHHCQEKEKSCKEAKSCCAKDIKEDCCSDEVQYFQIKLDYVNEVSNDLFVCHDVLPSESRVNVSEFTKEPCIALYPQPPPDSGREILILYQTFLI
jgi:hypothetical protein